MSTRKRNVQRALLTQREIDLAFASVGLAALDPMLESAPKITAILCCASARTACDTVRSASICRFDAERTLSRRLVEMAALNGYCIHK